MSWVQLADKYGLNPDRTRYRRVDLLKVDAEGLDYAIVGEVLDWYAEAFPLQSACSGSNGDTCVAITNSNNRARWPGVIFFEALESVPEYTRINARLHDAGYTCTRAGVADVRCDLS